jgi:cation transport regulator ChaC
MERRIAVFAYGSLVSAASASLTLSRPAEGVAPASLPGWSRRWSQVRDNRRCEKTFARIDDGWVPDHVLGLNMERSEDRADAPNGALIELTEPELQRLDRREIRYDRIDVTADVASPSAVFDLVVTYVAKPANLAPAPPPRSVILKSYVMAVEDAFTALGTGELERYLLTTGPDPAPRIEAELVRDVIPEGNPRAW